MAYYGEIRIAAFGVIPPGWMPCEGQLININSNQPLFSLLGTMYGGNGINTFALPDMRGRVPIHADQRDFFLGSPGGEESHALTVAELPQHTHSVMRKTTAATASDPRQNVLAVPAATLGDVYGSVGQPVTMASGAMLTAGSSAPHTNMQPYLALTFIICVNGFFPSQS
jgi:microcystin-dependent protein